MPGSTTSVFGEPDDYEAALQNDGKVNLLITGRGAFRATLTRITLSHMRLAAGVESLARIAFVSLPSHMMAISLPPRGDAALTLGGVDSQANEIVTRGPAQRIHERTDGPCHWRTIWLPARKLVRYGRAVDDAAFDVPLGVRRWRPAREALRRLSRLHDDAIQVGKTRPYVTAEPEATRGLEQELIEILIECMRVETSDERYATGLRHSDIMSRFEDMLHACPGGTSIVDICAALKIPDRTLRAYCKTHLGMGPHRYLRLRRMQLVHLALLSAESSMMIVSKIARQYGFDGPGHFAAAYREQFGELPSTTKRRRAFQ